MHKAEVIKLKQYNEQNKSDKIKFRKKLQYSENMKCKLFRKIAAMNWPLCTDWRVVLTS